ncbi:YkgJ family cysteine cluster protein [Pontixanthobacter aquaemixtae]|uniref:Flagellin N-methylase n=1 Tax=Pontixanthobacter aquaemixtae TaxID=1958940 RepID=A0A844ZSS6_9SPHN|nr:YkgJ family cysteine cluster protein [Pontixanthobacter aquaemixtae]MXO90362.1 hypothetical protein [Pontixanthobacter aquaemixtae]
MTADKPVTSQELSDICLSCGMCCEGTLYSHIPLKPEEIAKAEGRGWKIDEIGNGETGFLSPCHALSGACCTIYGDRPSVCGAYSCRVLRRVKNGRIAVEEGQSIIAKATSLRDQLRQYVPAGTTLFDFRRKAADWVDNWQQLSKAERKELAPAMLLITELTNLLDKEVLWITDNARSPEPSMMSDKDGDRVA